MLSDFWRPVSVAGKPLAEERFAFVMDGEHGKSCECPDLRKHVGLGECDCCDYCRPHPALGIAFLVEETRLTTRRRNYQLEFARMRLDLDEKEPIPDEETALADKRGEKYADNRIVWRNRLKVYGGALALCRYAAKCAEFAALMGGEKFRFLLVDGDTTDEKDERDLEFWRQKLLLNLRNLFSPGMIEDVKVIRAADLPRELPPGRDIPRP